MKTAPTVLQNGQILTWAALLVAGGLFFFALVAIPVLAEDTFREPVRFGSQEFRPLTYAEDGVLKGIHADMRRELMKEAGLAFTDVLIPLSRKYYEVKRENGRIDAWTSMDIDSVKAYGVPVRPSIFLSGQLSLFALAGTKIPAIEGLRTGGLIKVFGYNYNHVADDIAAAAPGMQIVDAPTHQLAFRMLKEGRARYLLDYWQPGMLAARNEGIDDVAHIEILDKPIVVFISHKYPNVEALVARLSAASKRILARREALAIEEGAHK
ncbi:MAG: transporter substrate-binding domain-containing protein [Kordiimonadaceae bacterium]|nr:transporter substrate-binding domain-containing protein [Kordiimonadaceae bacterium]